MTATINASTTSGVIVTSDTSGNLAIQSNGTTIATASSTGLQISTYNPGASLITSGTAQASTSGTSIDFTSIPSWVKRVTVMFSGVSVSGTSVVLIQLGTSGGVEATNYLGCNTTFNVNALGTTNHSTGFRLSDTGVATYLFHGSATICLLSSNNWTIQGAFGNSETTRNGFLAGSKSLSGALDRVRITTVNGTDTFDAGSINILYE